MKENPDGTLRLSGEEMQLLQLLACLHGMLAGKGGLALTPLMRHTPRGYVRYRQALGILDRLLDDVYRQVERRQLVIIHNVLKNGEIGIKLRRAGAYDDDLSLVRTRALEGVIRAGIKSQCVLCLAGRDEVRDCALRVALEEVFPPDRWETTGCCYRDMMVRGEV